MSKKSDMIGDHACQILVKGPDDGPSDLIDYSQAGKDQHIRDVG